MSYYVYFFEDGELQSVTNEKDVSSALPFIEVERQVFLDFSDQLSTGILISVILQDINLR